MNLPFGRRLFANGTEDRHGLPRLQPRPSRYETDVNDDENSSDGKTKTRKIAMKQGGRRGAVKALEPETEHFDLDAVGSSDSGGDELLRRTNVRRKLVRIRTSPVLPPAKLKPSYVELSDLEDAQSSDNEDWDVIAPHGTSKSKGKARAVSKRKAVPESAAYGHGQRADVRAGTS